MLAPCVLNRLIRDCGKSSTYFIGWCHKNCCFFSFNCFYFLLFFFSRKVQLSLCAKEFCIQHQRHSSCPRTENCIQLSSFGVSNSRNPFLRHENIFQLTAYGFLHWTFIAWAITYFRGQFITKLCVFLAMTTLCRDFSFFTRFTSTNFTLNTGKIFSATPNDLTIFSSAKSDFFIHPKVGNFNIIKITAM